MSYLRKKKKKFQLQKICLLVELILIKFLNNLAFLKNYGQEKNIKSICIN